MANPPFFRTLGWWALCWALLGVVTGGVMAFWDTGHIPRWAVPPLLMLVGAVGGLVGATLYSLGALIWGEMLKTSVWLRLSWAALCGGSVGGLLYLVGLGIILPYCLVGGVTAGLLSTLRFR